MGKTVAELRELRELATAALNDDRLSGRDYDAAMAAVRHVREPKLATAVFDLLGDLEKFSISVPPFLEELEQARRDLAAERVRSKAERDSMLVEIYGLQRRRGDAAEMARLDAEVTRLRSELDSERAQHRANVDGFESALATEAYERSILDVDVALMRPVIEKAKACREVRDVARTKKTPAEINSCIIDSANAFSELFLAVDAIDGIIPASPAAPAVDDESRCAVCGWQLAARADRGCVRGNCSQRPRPAVLYAPDRAAKEAEDLHERALRNGMPPSGRWA